MSYFEGVDMKRVETELKAGKKEIVAVFHNGNIFRLNEYQRFFELGNGKQVLKTKSEVRVMMASELLCWAMVRWLIHIQGNLVA